MKKAFTLIEVLLALVLMSIVLYIIGFAIETSMRLMESSRTEVEETQLARALLEKISRDIRSVVVASEPENLQIDPGIFDSMFESSMGIDASSLLGETTGSEDSEESSSGTSGGVVYSEELPEAGTVVGSLPGIYGSLDWIQIDTGRLPRGETYQTDWVLAEGTSRGDRSSPTKTAFYYLGEGTGSLSREESAEEKISGSLGQSYERYSPSYGLYRRQLDRYVSEYAYENSLEAEYEEYDEALAPEVENIEFYYYDSENEEWIDYWDMDEFGTLPGAVQVILEVRKKFIPRSTLPGMFRSSQEEIPTLTYSIIVPMPLSYVAPETEEEGEND